MPSSASVNGWRIKLLECFTIGKPLPLHYIRSYDVKMRVFYFLHYISLSGISNVTTGKNENKNRTWIKIIQFSRNCKKKNQLCYLFKVPDAINV